MGAVRKYTVVLDPEQRARLEALAKNGRSSAKKILHARVLLMADEEHPEGRWRDVQIARILNIHRNTIGDIRRRFFLEGEAPALNRRRYPVGSKPRKVDGEIEAQLVALCCSPPPAGRVRWTVRLLASELERRRIVISIGRETVRRALKKTRCSLGAKAATASRSVTAPASSHSWKTSSTSTPPNRTRMNR